MSKIFLFVPQIFLFASMLTLGIAGSRHGVAAAMSNDSEGGTPRTTYMAERHVKRLEPLKRAVIDPGAIEGSAIEGKQNAKTKQEARSRRLERQQGLGPKGVRHDFNFGRR